MKNKKTKYSISILFLCVSCTAVNTSINPSFTPTPSNNKTPVPSSSILPSNSATPTPNPTPVINQTPSPTLTPTLAPITNSQDISKLATINGKVFDDSGATMDGIDITVESLESNSNFKVQQKTINGTYVFRDVPVGIKLKITAFKNENWTKREQTYIAKSNLQGVSFSNVVDFGDVNNIGSPDKTNFYFLTNAPEIIDVIPKNQLLKYDQMTFKLIFSESVKKSSVEKNLYLRYVKDSFSPNTILGDGNNGTDNTDGPPLIKGLKQIIIDEFVSNRKFTWDTLDFDDYGKEVTFSFDGANGVLTDKNNQIKYGLTIRKNSREPRIVDREGNLALFDGEFFTNPSRGKNIIFNVESDLSSPYIESLVLVKNNNNCIIRINFSELMRVEGLISSDVSKLSFYKFYKNNTLIDLSNSNISINTGKSIEIISPTSTFSEGDTIKVQIDPNLKDPAGNFFSQGITLGEFDNIRETRFEPK